MNYTTLSDYLESYGSLIADRARAAFEPLHVPATDEVVALDLARAMLPAQAHVVTAAAKTLRRQKAVFLSCECGTGKTQMGACTVHAHATSASGTAKPYRAIVLAPPHLIETWRAELRAIFPDGTVDVMVLERWEQLLLWQLVWRHAAPKRPVWLIIAETTAKNGPYWEPAAVKDHLGILRCSTCGSQLRSKDGNEGDYLTMADLKKSRKFCRAEYTARRPGENGEAVLRKCGAALWQYTAKERIWAPANYIHKHMPGTFDYLIIDEAHQEKSDASARAHAAGALIASVKKVVAMTGTLIGGKASHVRSLLFRMTPRTLRAEDLSWKDDMEFARRYGRVDTVITEKESSGDDNRRSRGKSKSTRQTEQPGVMPTLYGRHLIGNTIFLGLSDVAESLPPYEEIPTPVAMSAALAKPYEAIEKKLKEACKELLRKGSQRLLGAMLHGLLAYPDYPYDWKLIGYEDVKENRWVPVVAPPTLDRNTVWPKERKLLEILAAEKAQGRQVWVFAVYTSTHPVLQRLETIIRRAGFRVKVLDADKVPTRDRSRWIAEHAPEVDVMISHPAPVETGLTLFDAAGRHNFPTLVFYETGYSIFTLRQASRRSWRIGQRQPCRVYFLYYKETMQERAMSLMAKKLEASLALEGQFSADGLAAMCGDGGSLAMELAKSLVENIRFEEVERSWAKT